MAADKPRPLLQNSLELTTCFHEFSEYMLTNQQKILLAKIFNNPNSVFAMQEEGWKLNRNHYYQEGWLSTANLRGVVGVTYTTSHCGIDGSTQLVPPSRTNYNLRGHRAEVGNLKKKLPRT